MSRIRRHTCTTIHYVETDPMNVDSERYTDYGHRSLRAAVAAAHAKPLYDGERKRIVTVTARTETTSTRWSGWGKPLKVPARMR